MKKENNKKIVVIYFEDDWKKKVPLNDATATRESFENWHERGLDCGIEFFRASIGWYNEKKNVFEKSWAYRDKKWQKIEKPIKPDLIFDKIAGKKDYELFDWKMTVGKKTKIFNHPLFRALCDNKLNQYILFKEFMPSSFLINNHLELNDVLKKIKSLRVVIKPFYGSGGFGIFIGTKNDALKQKIEFPVLVQEFIKSEKGIPGFSQKKMIADLRLVFINHKLIYALSRIAKKGSLFTNFHQGATAILVPKNKIPKSVNKIVQKIIDKLSLFKKNNYSLDFIFKNNGGPVLIEMNTTPGLDLLGIVGNKKIKKEYFEEFISILK